MPDEAVEEICSWCGCATVMHETPDSVGTHSMDIGVRLVCPYCYCWMRPEVTRLRKVVEMQDEKATDEELADARIRAEHEAEKYQYTIWVRMLNRLEAAEAEVTRLRAKLDAVVTAQKAIDDAHDDDDPVASIRAYGRMEDALAALDEEGT
jgi:hypothetical protein